MYSIPPQPSSLTHAHYHFRFLKKDEYGMETFGFLLEEDIDSVCDKLNNTIETPYLGEVSKECALRQVLLALRNTAIYYKYKNVATTAVSKLTERQSERYKVLKKMVDTIDEEDADWVALEKEAIQFIETNFNYYERQPKVQQITPYLIFNSGMAILKIEGHFYYTAGIELVFPDKEGIKPSEIDPYHHFITFKIPIPEFGLLGKGVKNCYQMALLRCPWTHQGKFSSTQVVSEFELVLAAFSPPGKVHYVVSKIIESAPSEKEFEIYQDEERVLELNWNEVFNITLQENERLKTLLFVDNSDTQFSLNDPPLYITIEATEARKYYTGSVIFPFEKEEVTLIN